MQNLFKKIVTVPFNTLLLIPEKLKLVDDLLYSVHKKFTDIDGMHERLIKLKEKIKILSGILYLFYQFLLMKF